MADKKTENFLKLYDYSLPSELIARKPAVPRDSAKLLVFQRKTKKVFFDTFRNLEKYLPPRAVLVMNNTKVLPARLVVKKETGGLARILCVGQKNNLLEFLSDRKLMVGAKVNIDSRLFFIVEKKVEGHYFLKPSFPKNKIFEVLEKYGITPIPPYIKNSPLQEKQLRKEYQTVFAQKKGSVAAPTASLHFTKNLLNKIRKSGRKIVYVTLHVNLGTFAPVTEENLEKARLHTEYYEIDKKSAEILNQAKKKKMPVIAVGTTMVRALESAVGRKPAFINESRRGVLKSLRGETDIFIKEGDKFGFIDGLITNFHVPKSSLMMLVAAMIGRKELLSLYQRAIDKKFRFFSFGDGMLVL